MLLESEFLVESFLGHFSLARGVLWCVSDLYLVHGFAVDDNDDVVKALICLYKFYIFFVAFAYVNLFEGLQHVSYFYERRLSSAKAFINSATRQISCGPCRM